MSDVRRPLVVVRDEQAAAAAAAELAGAGWTPAEAGVDRPATYLSFTVRDRHDAEAAVLAALRGDAVLARADAGTAVAGDLVDDLTAIAPTLVLDAATAVRLDVETWRVAHEVARGVTLEAAARALHLSPRTANRRLSAARRALGAESRAQLVRALAGPDRIPRAG